MSWDRLEEILEGALAQPEDARAAWVERTCAGDASLRSEVEALLAASRGARALAIERLVVEDAAPGDPWLGRSLGRWRLTRAIGQGGMGVVYGAERADGHYRQEAAVKLMRAGPRDPYADERFRTERQVLAALKHPNIARLLDGGFAPDGTPYLVMELVDGIPITEWCRRRSLSLEARLALFRVVCDAVQHAHRALVVHRDLKPSNILVSVDGEVKLLDFGIAKLLDPAAWGIPSSDTRAEMRALTPEYSAPEQRGSGPVTTATDVYALGVLLYELVAGVRPDADAVPPSEALRRNAPPAPAEPADSASAAEALDRRRRARRVRGDLDRIVLKALREEPDRRYESAGQLGEEVGRYLEGRPVLAQPDTVGYRLRKFAARNRLAVALAGVSVASLAAFGAVSAWQARVLAEQKRAAQQERDASEQVARVLIDLFETTNPSVRPDGDKMPVGEFLRGSQARSLALLKDVPQVRASLQHVFGLIHQTRGQYGPARLALQDALGERRRLLGPDAPASLESLEALGEVCHEAGDDERARAYLEESLERHRRIFGERHPRTARVLQALGAVTAVRDIERAGELWRQALEIRRATLPADDPDIAASLSTIAGYHYERHELERARDVYREALAVFRKPEDRRHPLNLSIRNDLAAVLGQLGAHDEAEALQREALEIGREVLGPESATVADLVNNLAFTQATARKFREAESSFRDSFEMHRSLFGDDHWRTRNVARNVARALELQERYGEALPWIDRASGTLRGRTEADDGGPELIRAQRAQILFRIGRREEALDEARQAVDSIAHSVDGRAAWRLATARIVLGRILIESGQPHEAESPLAAALVYFAGDRAEPDRRAEASCELARARLLQGGGPDDRRRLHECLPVYRAWAVADRESLAALERLDHS